MLFKEKEIVILAEAKGEKGAELVNRKEFYLWSLFILYFLQSHLMP